jgi:HlyD family type I secretion membrane fusion protein
MINSAENADGSTPALVPEGGITTDQWKPAELSVKPRWGKAMYFGYFIVGVFFFGFGGFAAFAELDSAILATGEVRVEREPRVIQHDTPGVLKEILVREGQRVEKGDVLLRLDPTSDRATRRNTRVRLYSAMATLARFQSERAGSTDLVFPEELLEAAKNDPDLADLVENERNVFKSRLSSLAGSINLRLEQMDQIREQIRGMALDQEATKEQLALIGEELEGVEQLYREGLERKPRLLALQREQSALRGRIGRLGSDQARLRQQIGELELQAEQVERDFQREVVAGIERTSVELQQLRSQLEVSERRVDRLEIRAPQTGVVLNLAVNTIGSYVQPGRTLMEIVPTDENLIVVARIKPIDIEHVKPLENVHKVQVRLTAFSQRFTHPIEAKLLSISDDTIVQDSGPGFYRAIIQLDEESKERILPGIPLSSGMPAMAMLSTGTVTLLDYIIEPLYLSISLALREPSDK